MKLAKYMYILENKFERSNPIGIDRVDLCVKLQTHS